MGSGNHKRAKELFVAAIERNPEEREKFLREACGGDPGLLREIESLLQFHEEHDDLLDAAIRRADSEPTAAPDGTEPGADAESISERIPDFRLLRKIGEGGMGEVYEAEQLRPVRRRVAVKVIKAGMDSKAVVARFESERQALALMDHPAIARVLDAGTTEQGRPYFAMEQISGEPITAYCDRHRLSTRERLELFIQVCDGVQHAHQKGIIHRDLKPSNVLVRNVDDRPMPAIIDFGIAKATQQRLTEKTMFTAMGAMIGTPEYMSPEQAEMTGLDVDTRSDIYSLGVVLYELLAGALPFDSTFLREAGFDEIRRRIREDEPSKPSTRVTTLGDATSGTAERRRTNPQGLRKQLRGDLDWVTMKALEKDRDRRYASPAELAADIGRHLRHEPVLAGPPGLVYRGRKFVRRHRVGVAAAIFVIAALLLGIAGTTTGLLRARQEAETARRVSGVLVGLVGDLSPFGVRPTAGDPGEILSNAEERVARELAGEPLAQAQLLLALGNAHWGIGRFEEAQRLFERSLSLRREQLGNAHPDVAESLAHLGDYWFEAGDYDEASRVLEEALEIRRNALGPDHELVGRTLMSLGNVFWRRGELEIARELTRRALEIQEAADRPDDLAIAATLYLLALIEVDAGDCDAAQPHLDRALRIREAALGTDHLTVASVLNDVGRCQLASGDSAGAASTLRRAVAIVERTGGADHPNLGIPLMNLGRSLTAVGDYEAAREQFERALQLQEQALGPDHPNLAYTLMSYGALLRRTGELDAARGLLRRAMAIAEETFGPEHLDLARTASVLGRVERDAGNLAESRLLFERALESYRNVHGPVHRSVAGVLYSLACLSATEGDREAALKSLREAVEAGLTRGDLPDSPESAALRADPQAAAILRKLESDPSPAG